MKVQVEFDPEQVAAYRLVGHENRAIADEDFRRLGQWNAKRLAARPWRSSTAPREAPAGRTRHSASVSPSDWRDPCCPPCLDGRCTGAQKSCDDGDACTLDVCDAVRGCEHLTAAPCPGDGKCQVGVCDPAEGCKLARALDGTFCGPTRTCEVAEVCIGGACVQRDPPDGFVCAHASPCQGEGRCAGAVCERPAPSPLQPDWSFDSMTVKVDGGTEKLHDMVLEPDGAMSLMSFFGSPPVVRANTAGAKRLASAARRCILWNTRLVCADFPYSAGGKVTSVDPATGASGWSFPAWWATPWATPSRTPRRWR